MAPGRLARLGLYAIECRGLRHAWVLDGVERDGAIRIVHLECNRCTATRVDEIRASGDLIHRRYKLPPGYRMPPGGPRVRIDAIRKELLRRWKVT